MDRLQMKIRKIKNPVVLDMTVSKEQLPPHLLKEEGTYLRAYGKFCIELMEALQGELCAVRYSYGLFSLLGTDGLAWLSKICDHAKNLGYYVFLDLPDVKTTTQSSMFAQLVFDQMFPVYFDGLIVTSYIGTDGYAGYLPFLNDMEKDLFIVLRSSNKSAAQLQDLMTGGRLVHTAIADELVRSRKGAVGKCGYSNLGGVAASAAPASLQNLRSKYKELFLIVDSCDASHPNTKNCALGFDAFGHGAILCVGTYITCAWKTEMLDGSAFAICAKEAAAKLKGNISRYISIL